MTTIGQLGLRGQENKQSRQHQMTVCQTKLNQSKIHNYYFCKIVTKKSAKISVIQFVENCCLLLHKKEENKQSLTAPWWRVGLRI